MRFNNLIVFTVAFFLFIGLIPHSAIDAQSLILKNGDRHPEVIQLKLDLEKAGFKVSDNPTSLFGSITEAKVKEFQSAHGLVADGIAGPATFSTLQDVISDLDKNTSASSTPSLLRFGDRHPAVVQLKRDLDKAGFTVPGNTTEYFGSQTEAQVTAFQRAHGLTADGIVGPATFSKLEEVVQQSASQSSPSVLRFGDRHPAVVQLKLDLDQAGFTVPGNTTEYFGPQTEAQVKAFQRANGLTADGIAGPATFTKLAEVIQGISEPRPSLLRIGDRHAAVIQLKEDLDKVGFTVPGNTTNYFGSQTEAQVKAFQQAYRLTADGIAGQATFSKLEEVIKSGHVVLRNGVYHQDVVQLKVDLGKLGYSVPGNTTTFFGSQTEAQVKAFQNDHNLVATGVADALTLQTIQAATSAPPSSTPSLLRLGDRHDAVIELKEDLDKVGFTVPGNTTTYFGSNTEAQVKAFQRSYGLSADGIAGPATLNKLNEVKSNRNLVVLRNGVSHSSVVQLKINLGKAGFPVPGNTTSLFGSQTEAQVKAFQRAHGLVASGVADPYTLEVLQNTVKNSSTGSLSGKRIVIDAGHGGRDSGAPGVNGLYEKIVVLDISKRVETKLKAAGATVIMTRTNDTYISLDERVRIANTSNASAFVSVHTNAFNGSARGVETWWNQSHSSALSRNLAEEIQKELVPALQTLDRGVKHGTFQVIRSTTIPAVLVEAGFIDNSSDGSKLGSTQYRERVADAIYKGLVSHYNKR
ncbi:N-acetylmuramoyl-L-alanine amidase [Halalkalibacter krulwichiae]|uniref:N-acetylmuramoyl-L-alanine amidase LytC n=1 Tax=Halalkalibacter krulwichiae TaxID=199441 RepID=A0A1X9MHQ9_9BACI|nr:peptidoglycan-binding protein [Halalkalibacter krulwichiae]ARK32204.1 N-acetylmuramoyl-L-alanine amidase LytC precursor [Halalkalibacter krulwichiae]